MKKVLALLLAFILPALTCSCCAQQREKRYSAVSSYAYFDTVCSFYMGADNAAEFSAVKDEVFSMLARLHGLFDVYNDYDEPNLKTVNDAAGVSSVKVAEEIVDLLSFSLSCAEKTGGAFDPAAGAVTRLWKASNEAGKPPEKAALAEAGKHIGPSLLEIDPDEDEVYLTDPYAKIDAGAVAKGYAARKVREFLEEKHIENWLLALGGSICAGGVDPETGKDWAVGIRDPFEAQKVYGSYSLSGDAIATSGSYERYFDFEGVRYHHIIDPKTLCPADSGTVSVSVFCGDPALADVLSTAFFVMGEKDGSKIAEEFGVRALFIDENGDETVCGELREAPKKSTLSTADIVVLVFLGILLLAVLLLLLLRRKADRASMEDRENRRSFSFKRRDVVLLVVLAALTAALCLLLPHIQKENADACAVVRVNGREEALLDLNIDRTYEVQTDKGRNLIVVQSGRVYISEADCPGQDCVRAGALDASSIPGAIACLPHGLTVSVEERERE